LRYHQGKEFLPVAGKKSSPQAWKGKNEKRKGVAGVEEKRLLGLGRRKGEKPSVSQTRKRRG